VCYCFFFQAEDGIRDFHVTGVQTCALPILVKRDNVDVVIGTVHSGVAMAMARIARQTGTLMINPNAGADAVTGPMCAKNIFRSSFSNLQPGYPTGEALAKTGAKNVVTITWKYAAGDESVGGLTDAFEKGGGQVVENPT